MNCPDCGIEVERDANFCPKCFARIERPGMLRRIMGFFQNATKPGVHVLKSEKTVNIVTVDKDGTRHEYHSLKEVPLAMRSQFEKLESEVLKEKAELLSPEALGQAQDTGGVVRKKSYVVYKIKDDSGREHVYHSLDEVPPEMRSRVEHLGADLLKETNLLAADGVREIQKTSGFITTKNVSIYNVKDASGQERTYHSMEELPPEIQEMLKRMQGKTGE